MLMLFSKILERQNKKVLLEIVGAFLQLALIVNQRKVTFQFTFCFDILNEQLFFRTVYLRQEGPQSVAGCLKHFGFYCFVSLKKDLSSVG